MIKNIKKIKVNYNKINGNILGYYPNSFDYASIPEPFIEITEEEHQEGLSKNMCIINGLYKEYIKPDDILLQEAKAEKISKVKAERNRLVSGAQTYTITVDGISCSFALSNADLPNLIARQSCLNSVSETVAWNDIDNNRIELNKAAFLSLIGI